MTATTNPELQKDAMQHVHSALLVRFTHYFDHTFSRIKKHTPDKAQYIKQFQVTIGQDAKAATDETVEREVLRLKLGHSGDGGLGHDLVKMGATDPGPLLVVAFKDLCRVLYADPELISDHYCAAFAPPGRRKVANLEATLSKTLRRTLRDYCAQLPAAPEPANGGAPTVQTAATTTEVQVEEGTPPVEEAGQDTLLLTTTQEEDQGVVDDDEEEDDDDGTSQENEEEEDDEGRESGIDQEDGATEDDEESAIEEGEESDEDDQEEEQQYSISAADALGGGGAGVTPTPKKTQSKLRALFNRMRLSSSQQRKREQ